MKTSELEQLCKEYMQLSKGIINKNKHAMYVSTFHSTCIEGSTLTESQVIDLLYLGKTAKGKPFEHHQMVNDHYNALNFVLTAAKNKRQLSTSFIQEVASKVMKNTGSEVNTILGTYDISKGDFRLSGVSAGRRQFPDAKKVASLLKKIVSEYVIEIQKAKTFQQKCEISFRIHFEFVSIHPFGDGNGRTARLLMNFTQAYFNLPLSIVFKQNRLKYIEALEESRKKENLTPFYDFMFSQYSKLINSEIKEMKRST